MEIIVRKILPQDIAQVYAIETAVFSDAWSLQGFEDSLDNENVLLLAAVCETPQMQAQTVLGYCCLYGALDEGEIVNVAVHPDFRRLGIGEMLVRALIDTARGQGIVYFYLEVRVSNDAARQLYCKLGFKMIGVRKNFYEKPTENALVMKLET